MLAAGLRRSIHCQLTARLREDADAWVSVMTIWGCRISHGKPGSYMWGGARDGQSGRWLVDFSSGMRNCVAERTKSTTDH